MRSEKPSLSKGEWNLMEKLWEDGHSTASDLQKRLSDEQGWAYSTVKTMLDRLVEKGLVSARRVGNVYEYAPKLRRQSAVGRVLDDVFERVLEGSLTPFVSRLIENQKLKPEEINKLRELLDRYEEDSES